MLFNKLVNTHQPQLSDYPFDVLSMKITLTMLFSLMIILFVINNFKISFKTPCSYCLKIKVRHMKSPCTVNNIFNFRINFIGIGYYLAIKPNTAIGSLGILFLRFCQRLSVPICFC